MPGTRTTSAPEASDPHEDLWRALRAGILLGGAYKLIARVPRWVARRRFKARALDSDEDVSLFFFPLTDEELTRWQRECRTLVPFADPNLFPISRVEQFQRYRFVVGDWIEGEDLEMYLMENGPLDPAQARTIFQDLLASARRLFFAGLPVPDLHPARILLAERDGTLTPLLFPLSESDEPVLKTEEAICSGLRDLLFCLLTGLEGRGNYNERMLQLLPRAISAVWEPVFLEEPNFDLLREHVDMALPLRAAAPLQPRAPRPPEPVEPEDLEPPPRRTASRAPVPPSGMELPPRRRPVRSAPPSPNNFLNFLGLGIALLAPLALGWAAWHFIFVREPAEPQVLSMRDLDPDAGLPPIPGDNATGPQTSPGPARLPAPSSPSDPPSSQFAPALPPSHRSPPALPRDPAARLRTLAAEIPRDPQSVYLIRELDDLLAELTRSEAEIRSGKQPQIFQALEETAQAHPDIAIFLARVLWGRDTPRAESIYIELARQGNPTAREICRQRLLNWENPPGTNTP